MTLECHVAGPQHPCPTGRTHPEHAHGSGGGHDHSVGENADSRYLWAALLADVRDTVTPAEFVEAWSAGAGMDLDALRALVAAE